MSALPFGAVIVYWAVSPELIGPLPVLVIVRSGHRTTIEAEAELFEVLASLEAVVDAVLLRILQSAAVVTERTTTVSLVAVARPNPHSFPTRRSSDLVPEVIEQVQPPEVEKTVHPLAVVGSGSES